MYKLWSSKQNCIIFIFILNIIQIKCWKSLTFYFLYSTHQVAKNIAQIFAKQMTIRRQGFSDPGRISCAHANAFRKTPWVYLTRLVFLHVTPWVSLYQFALHLFCSCSILKASRKEDSKKQQSCCFYLFSLLSMFISIGMLGIILWVHIQCWRHSIHIVFFIIAHTLRLHRRSNLIFTWPESCFIKFMYEISHSNVNPPSTLK